MESKIGNITITVLVISVLLLCSIALVTFTLAKTKIINVFTGVFLVEDMNSQIEDFSTNKDLNRVDTKINDKGVRVFYKERIESSGFWIWSKEKVSFSVEYPVPP